MSRDNDFTILWPAFSNTWKPFLWRIFLNGQLNLPWHNLRPFPLDLSPVIWENRPIPVWLHPPASELCRARRSPLSLLSSTWATPVPSATPGTPDPCPAPLASLDMLQPLLVVGSPELPTGFAVSAVPAQGHFPFYQLQINILLSVAHLTDENFFCKPWYSIG